MADTTTIVRIPKLNDSTNYQTWKLLIKDLLLDRNLWDAIVDDPDALRHEDMKLLNVAISRAKSIHGVFFSLVGNFKRNPSQGAVP
jgi:hypothetical protein